jgi:hypothetical protein
LAHRHQLEGVDSAQVVAARRNELPRPDRDPLTKEARPPAGLRDEADILAVRFGRRAQANLGSHPAHLVLGHLSDGQQHSRKLGLAKHVENVGLVLRTVAASA